MVGRHEDSPDWLILVDEDRRVSSLAEQMLGAASPGKARILDQVVFYCTKSLDDWSVDEKSEFEVELESAIDFLSQLAPADNAEQDPPADVDSERRLQLARERRDQLLADEEWIDAPAVHAQQGGKSDSQGINNTASRLRRRGELLGAWNGREFLHPTFQFQPDTGRLMPEMKILLDILPKDRSGSSGGIGRWVDQPGHDRNLRITALIGAAKICDDGWCRSTGRDMKTFLGTSLCPRPAS